ncbi:phosphopantetheine-binding protein [Zhongshania aliphaticivorans]|uniref:phosphopantetheine-binding protein n=1 Tax=Zhongshania aliphaticivorans TaxID=1470434 RepID=UPI00133075AE|nr:phosphopantetheine-binding protein [Zhongshania aliphaticivorans]
MSNQSLIQELKALLIQALDLEDISIDDISDTDPLFHDGLGLDSIDALEIGVALQKKYGIKLNPDSDDVKTYFSSVSQLAKLVELNRTIEG